MKDKTAINCPSCASPFTNERFSNANPDLCWIECKNCGLRDVTSHGRKSSRAAIDDWNIFAEIYRKNAERRAKRG
jgi:transcription elongation factor Elf1